MAAFSAVAWLVLYSTILGIAGYLPAWWFFNSAAPFEGVKLKNPMIIVAALLLGPLCFNLLVFFVSIVFRVGVRMIAKPLLFGLLLAVVITLLFRRDMRHDLVAILVDSWTYVVVILLVVLPVAGLHILVPMWRESWLVAYSIGNDSVRYLLMMEYLQDHY